MAEQKTKDKLSTAQKWELIIVVALISDILIVILNGIISYVSLGRLSIDYLVIGTIDAMVVPIIIAPFVVYLFNEERTKVKALIEQAQDDMAKAKEASERALEKLQEADRKVQELERIRADFFSTLTGELSAPLTAIIMGANKLKAIVNDEKLLITQDKRSRAPISSTSSVRAENIASKVAKDRDELVHGAKETVDMILSTGNRLASTLNVVVELAGIDIGLSQWNDEDMDFSEVLKKVAYKMSPHATTRGLFFNRDVQAGEYVITADQMKLTTMVTNLFDNSISLTSTGGVVYRLRKETGKLIFEVEDTGWEIPDYMAQTIFGRGQTVDSSGSDRIKRVALILTLCKKIVEHYGGDIWRENTSGGVGNKIIIVLPLAKAETSVWVSTKRER